jgi:hypothetical protein
VQEVNHVNNDLDGGKSQYRDCCRLIVPERATHYEPERDRSQNNGETEAREIAARGCVNVAAIVSMIVMAGVGVVAMTRLSFGAHRNTPMR